MDQAQQLSKCGFLCNIERKVCRCDCPHNSSCALVNVLFGEKTARASWTGLRVTAEKDTFRLLLR
jgi:hypothetical protein